MTKSRKTDYSHVDIDKLLEQRRQVAIIWSVEDVQQQRPDLDDDQAWQVLQKCRNRHDCDSGFSWDLIDAIADQMFPDSQTDA